MNPIPMKATTPTVVNIQNAPAYSWGQNCTASVMWENETLSVKEEMIPSGASEQEHMHTRSEQLFYILSGHALFKLNKEEFELHQGDSIHVAPGIFHAIRNESNDELRILVISSPAIGQDRVLG